MRISRSWRLALAGATLFSGAALAQPPSDMPMHGGMMGPGMGAGMGMGHGMMGGGWYGNDDHYNRMFSMHNLSALGLNADQRKKLTDLRRELRNNTWDLQRQEIDQREQLGLLYSADTLDVAAIKSAYEKLFQIKLKLIEYTLKFKQEVEKVLTKEQRQQFRDMMYGGMMGGQMNGPMGNMMEDSMDKQ